MKKACNTGLITLGFAVAFLVVTGCTMHVTKHISGKLDAEAMSD